jgi:tyrosyl-DNA phosphodiesterase-1
MVLKKEKNINNKCQSLENSLNPQKITNNTCNSSKECQDLKDKIQIEKWKKIKLDDPFKSKTDTFIRKRSSSNSIDNIFCTKKSILNHKDKSHINTTHSNDCSSNLQNVITPSSNQDSISKKSYIDHLITSDKIIRAKIRDNVILRMRQAGHKLYLCTPGKFAFKYALSAPYYSFLNVVQKSEITHNQKFTVSFPELLDISLGEIVDSLHINFMVEIGWLCLQYLLAAQNPKMTVFCGSVNDPQTSLPPNINLIVVNMPSAYGCHHSKISIFKYNDNGIRIVISTANIYNDDWENRTQG